jgi:uncharacterized protein HemX
MKRYLRFFPVILAALALAAGGSTFILRQASAQQGNAQKGGQKKEDPQKGGATTLSVEAQQQIRALLEEKWSRTPAQRKVSSHLLNAMKAQRGQAMTRGGEVRALNSAMPMAKPGPDGRVLVNIKSDVTKELAMIIEKLGGGLKTPR